MIHKQAKPRSIRCPIAYRLVWGAAAAIVFGAFFWLRLGHSLAWVTVGSLFGFAGGYFAGPEAFAALIRHVP
jgi:hypothetical protein